MSSNGTQIYPLFAVISSNRRSLVQSHKPHVNIDVGKNSTYFTFCLPAVMMKCFAIIDNHWIALRSILCLWMIYRRISVDYTSEELLLMSIPVKKRSRTDHDVFDAPWKSSVEGKILCIWYVLTRYIFMFVQCNALQSYTYMCVIVLMLTFITCNLYVYHYHYCSLINVRLSRGLYRGTLQIISNIQPY